MSKRSRKGVLWRDAGGRSAKRGRCQTKKEAKRCGRLDRMGVPWAWDGEGKRKGAQGGGGTVFDADGGSGRRIPDTDGRMVPDTAGSWFHRNPAPRPPVPYQSGIVSPGSGKGGGGDFAKSSGRIRAGTCAYQSYRDVCGRQDPLWSAGEGCRSIALRECLSPLSGEKGPWIPHVTILIDEPETVHAALPLFVKDFAPFAGRITRLHLCAFWPTRKILTGELSGPEEGWKIV